LLPTAAGEADIFRVIFFMLTCFPIGVMSDFRKPAPSSLPSREGCVATAD
jgi:hypothetical protein